MASRPMFREFMKTMRVPPGRGTAVSRAVLEGKTTHINDVLNEPEYTFPPEGQKLGDYRTVLAIPLLREGNPIGVIVLIRRTVCPFTDKQIELAGTFADQAVIAIENVRLFEAVQARTRELTESLEQQTATSEVLQGHLQFAGRAGAGVPGDARKRGSYLRGQFRQFVYL